MPQHEWKCFFFQYSILLNHSTGMMNIATVHPAWREGLPFDNLPHTAYQHTQTHTQAHAHWGEKEVDNRRVTLRWSSLLNSFCWATIQAGQATQRSVQLGFPIGYCYYHSPAQVEEGDLRKAILSPAERDGPRFLGGSRSVSQYEACCSTVSSRWEEQQQQSDSLVQSSAQ